MQFNNILIVRTDRIGDVVLTTPAIKALRQTFPRARISILVSAATVDLVRSNPYLDEILIDDRTKEHKGILGFFKLIDQIRSRKFDMAIIFHTKRRYNLLCFLSQIRYRLGYKNNKFGFLLTNPIKDTRAVGESHEAEYCLELLKAIGVQSNDLDVFVPTDHEAEEWVLSWGRDHHVKSNEYILIHPDASDPAKCWPASNFAALINRITERYPLKVIIIGSRQTSSLALNILSQVAKPNEVIDLTGKISLSQLASLLRRCRMLISNDSGPVHMAAGVGTNVISIFMRNQPGINSERWRPMGDKAYILDNKEKPGQISVDDVLELVYQILQKNNQYEIF